MMVVIAQDSENTIATAEATQHGNQMRHCPRPMHQIATQKHQVRRGIIGEQNGSLGNFHTPSAGQKVQIGEQGNRQSVQR
jgi:hypothetical protein